VSKEIGAPAKRDSLPLATSDAPAQMDLETGT